MKNAFLILAVIFCFSSNAQVQSGFFVDASAGYSQPLGDYASYTKIVPEGPIGNTTGFTQEISGGGHFNMDIGYRFSSFGAALSIGTYMHNISDMSYDIPAVFSEKGGDINGMYYGVGPDYTLSLGRMSLAFMARGGLSTFSLDRFTARYESEALGEIDLLYTEQVKGSSNSSPYVSAGIKLGIPLSKRLNFILKVDYLQTLGDGFEISDTYYKIADVNQDNLINDFDLENTTNIDFLTTENRFLNPQMVNLSAGLQYNFGTSKQKQPKVDSATATVDTGDILFKNPSKRIQEERVLVGLTPKDRTSYKDENEIKEFTWELIGKPIPDASYAIEVIRVNSNGTPARAYFGQSSKLSISKEEVFMGNPIEDGSYRWRVTEKTTGLTSTNKTFTITSCDLNYTLSNDSIECLGYEGADRKYKICFDTTYQSATGDLDFVNAGSGLFVYDQVNNPLSYSLVGSNTSLVAQVGASSSTVSYCFEVFVDSTVTDIGFGLQGDDLDTSLLICQPSASAVFSDLPSCLCDECEDLTLSFDNFSTSVNPTASNQLLLSGALNANVPIYGVEFQIQSYSYTSSNNCTQGVTSVEESGMFLLPGTAVNNSSSLQFANESSSSDPLSNTNATKNIKYVSLTALNGNIPVDLMVGLPGPAMGMDASCCSIDYEVCIKVKIFYDESSCKSCVFTQCFNFNNQ